MSVQPTTLRVFIPEEFGFGRNFIDTSCKYAKPIITEKKWSNLLQRIWDAITHIFCEQVLILVDHSKPAPFWIQREKTILPTPQNLLENIQLELKAAEAKLKQAETNLRNCSANEEKGFLVQACDAASLSLNALKLEYFCLQNLARSN